MKSAQVLLVKIILINGATGCKNGSNLHPLGCRKDQILSIVWFVANIFLNPKSDIEHINTILVILLQTVTLRRLPSRATRASEKWLVSVSLCLIYGWKSYIGCVWLHFGSSSATKSIWIFIMERNPLVMNSDSLLLIVLTVYSETLHKPQSYKW